VKEPIGNRGREKKKELDFRSRYRVEKLRSICSPFFILVPK
jgi:hypothetical protein